MTATPAAVDVSCFPRMTDKVPEGESGNTRIVHGEIDRALSAQLYRYAAALGGEINYIHPPGLYCALQISGNTMMSDALFEKVTNLRVVEEARGDVLIAGLGIGMILWPIVAKPEVRTVTVIEMSRDVLTLVKPHVPTAKVRVIEADIFKWAGRCNNGFDAIYFDIWHTIGYSSALAEMRRLCVAYRRFLRRDGWMGCWEGERAENVDALAAERIRPDPARFVSPSDAAAPKFRTREEPGFGPLPDRARSWAAA